MDDSYIIAEMACSHDGSLNLGKVIIDAASDSGADAVQFQIWDVHDVVPDHKDVGVMKSVQLSKEEWIELFEYSRSLSRPLDVISCVYDLNAARFGLENGTNAFKVHTADLSNHDFLSELAAFGLRIDLSVGASSLVEIQEAIQVIEAAGNSNIWIMYGKQLFPTEVTDAEIRQACLLKSIFDYPVGYQDHTNGDSAQRSGFPALLAERHYHS